MNLSPHFTLAEMTKSEYGIRHGIDNTPSEEVIERMKLLCNNTLERIRAYIAGGHPIFINSGYRCPRINTGIGGAPTSQHLRGEAADIELPGMSHQAAISLIMVNEQIPFDQLIFEGGDVGWIHVSYNQNHLRRQVLTATFVNGKAIYTPFA